MAFDKKTKRDIVGITALGIGLGVATKVEAVAKPPIPVVTKFAPVAAVAGPVVGAGIVIRQLNRLPTKPIPEPMVHSPIMINKRRGIMRFL